MHEVSIAQEIIQSVMAETVGKKITAVTRIHISLGVLSGVEKYPLLQAFKLLPKDEILVKAKLTVKENVLIVNCQSCKTKTVIKDDFVLKCSRCGKPAPDIIKGKELTIDKIEYS